MDLETIEDIPEDKRDNEIRLIKKYLEKTKEADEQRNKLGALRLIRHIPYPQQLITLGLVFIGIILFVKYLPLGVDWLMDSYFPANIPENLAMRRNMFVASLGINIAAMGFGAIVFFFTSGVTLPWLKAGITRRPIIPYLSKSRTLQFKVPKTVKEYMWDIDNDNAIVPDSEAIINGPNKTSLMFGVPELGYGWNPRSLLRGIPLNIDTTVIKQYAREHEQKMYSKLRTGTDTLIKFMPWLIALIVIMVVLGPTIDQKLDQSGTINSLEEKYLQCREVLVDNGISPQAISKQPVSQDNSQQRHQPASTGGNVDRSDEIADKFKVS